MVVVVGSSSSSRQMSSQQYRPHKYQEIDLDTRMKNEVAAVLVVVAAVVVVLVVVVVKIVVVAAAVVTIGCLSRSRAGGGNRRATASCSSRFRRNTAIALADVGATCVSVSVCARPCPCRPNFLPAVCLSSIHASSVRTRVSPVSDPLCRPVHSLQPKDFHIWLIMLGRVRDMNQDMSTPASSNEEVHLPLRN